MASIGQILQELSTKEALASTADIASALKSTKEAILKQLKREKEKGTVEGNTEEGWIITDSGRKVLEKGGPGITMVGEGVTPREKFESIGRLIGINEDRITLAADIVWSQNYEDLNWVWTALGQADIRADLRKIWTNSWRAHLKKGIPPELELELAGTPATKTGEPGAGEVVGTRATGRDYIIDGDLPVRVGTNLGDYNIQDAKDLIALRALKDRFRAAPGTLQAGAAQGGVGQEKLSDIITALQPYLQKGTDVDTLKEILGDKLSLMRQDILSHIPPPGRGSQPKTLLEQLKELTDLGPVLRTVLGIPETPPASGNPFAGVPVKITGPDGVPIVMDLGSVINWKKFMGEEARADERHAMFMKLGETVRENIPDGIQSIIEAAKAQKAGTKTEAPQTQQAYECGQCHQRFSIPDVPFETVKCPNPVCGHVYTKAEVMGA